MANPPKLALMKLTPGGMAKKMAQVRQSKKAGKKKAVVRKTREKVKTSSPLQNVANAATSSNPTASAPLTPVADTPATPALVFSTTNNNRQRAVEQACRDREKEAAAAAPKLGDVQLTNPASNDYNLVVVVPAERPRRQIVPPKNRGAVVSMVDKRQAAEDGKLVKVLKESKAGRKRKAEEKTGPATAKRQVRWSSVVFD
jgi:hypothetical protein